MFGEKITNSEKKLRISNQKNIAKTPNLSNSFVAQIFRNFTANIGVFKKEHCDVLGKDFEEKALWVPNFARLNNFSDFL